MDTQQVEVIGRNALVSALIREGFEVAEPVRDRGVDLIGYRERPTFEAWPIQLKAFSRAGVSLDRKYAELPGLEMAYVWHCDHPAPIEIYRLGFPELIGMAERLGWTSTRSWTEGGRYATTSPSERVRAELEPYRQHP